MLVIDGVEYASEFNSNGTITHRSAWLDALTESFVLAEGHSSRIKQNGARWYDVIGTQTSHDFTIVRDFESPVEEWEALWQVLKSPVDSHEFEFPGFISYRAHVSGASRDLSYIDDSGNPIYDSYSISLIPVEVNG